MMEFKVNSLNRKIENFRCIILRNGHHHDDKLMKINNYLTPTL